MVKRVAAYISFLLLLCPTGLKSADRETQAIFAQAYSLFSQNQFTEAEALFLTTLQNDYLLSDYSLYFLARIALDRGVSDRARQHLTALKDKFPDSVWIAEANLRLAKDSLAAKDYARALQELRPLFDLKGRAGIACEARFWMAQIHALQGQPRQAYAAYQELRRAFPLCTWAHAARKETQGLQQQDPDFFTPASYERSWEEADLLLRQRQYREAERAFRNLLELFPDESWRPRSLFGLARAYAAQGKRAEEAPLLAVIANKYPHSPEAVLALNRLARIYWNADENQKALAYFNRLLERYPQSSFAASAHIAVARIYLSLGQPQETITMLRAFAHRFPTSPLRGEAKWRLAWIYYLQGNYERAYAAFKSLAAEQMAERYQTAALYWQGRTAEKTERHEEAKNTYLTLVTQYDESFYAGPARRRLKTNGQIQEVKISSDAPATDSGKLPNARFSFHLARARELAELSLSPFAVAELDAIREQIADPESALLLAREYARLGAYHRSVPLVAQNPAASDEVRMHRYPLAYWELVQRKAKERGLDPYLVLALIRQESLFDARAVSPAHAMGLMQLLPSTAARLAKQLGLPEPAPEQLFDPELNITLGTYYLQELMRLYADNPVKALGAYNAGEKAMARWERQIATDDAEEFIERITYGETLRYVKLVLRSRRLYHGLYADQK
ncbi:MAG: transglycosylase SLT domain-containing protein [Candidatus Binatia bacterium]